MSSDTKCSWLKMLVIDELRLRSCEGEIGHAWRPR